MHVICFVNLPRSATARLRKVSCQLPYLSVFPLTKRVFRDALNYANGDSECLVSTTEPITQAPIIVPDVTENDTPQNVEPVGMDYVVNANTHKFHYPSCSSVNQMAEHNKMNYNGSRDELIAQGYEPCKRCNP